MVPAYVWGVTGAWTQRAGEGPLAVDASGLLAPATSPDSMSAACHERWARAVDDDPGVPEQAPTTDGRHRVGSPEGAGVGHSILARGQREVTLAIIPGDAAERTRAVRPRSAAPVISRSAAVPGSRRSG